MNVENIVQPRGRRLRVLAALIVITVGLVSATSASAGGGFGAGNGGGAMAPGMTATPMPQVFFFNTSLARTGLYCSGVELTTPTSINVNGTDAIGSLAAGAGNVAALVSGGGCNFALNGVFVRTGLKMDLVLTSGVYVIHAACVLVPNQTPPAPIIGFTATCTVIFAGTTW